MAPRRVDHETRRAEICDAAVTVFARDGFQGATIDAIADTAGISKGSVYRYFADKETLFYAAFERIQETILAEGHDALAQADGGWAQLAALVRTTITGWQRHLATFPLVLELWAAASAGATRERLGAEMAGIYRTYRADIAALIRQGQADGELAADADPDATAAWMVGAIDGVLLQHWFDADVDPMNAGEALLATLARALRVPNADDRPRAPD